MKSTFLFISTILFLTSYSQHLLVKKRTKTMFWTYNEKGKKKTQKQPESFIVYDKQGREIELGDFGESTGTQVINKDSSVSWFCSKDYSKINGVDFTSYDKDGIKIKVESWYFKNNKKNWISGYKILTYGNNKTLSKEIFFSPHDSIEKTITYIYDNDLNNTLIIDSSFKPSYSSNKLSIYRTINKFDTLKRIVLKSEFSNEKLLQRIKFSYADDIGLITELRYHNESDTSLSSITETRFGDIEQFPYPKKKIEESFNIINSDQDRREVYIYDKNGLLRKSESYNGIKLTEYSLYEYEFY